MQHLCADAGYRGRVPEGAVAWHTGRLRFRTVNGCVPCVVGRREEADEKKTRPRRRARRWVVEAAHGWPDRFRKPLVRYERPAGPCLALRHLAAAIIVFRKVRLPENIFTDKSLVSTRSS